MLHEQIVTDILSVRQFNRFYTRAFGFLQKRILGSAYSLIEARVLYDRIGVLTPFIRYQRPL